MPKKRLTFIDLYEVRPLENATKEYIDQNYRDLNGKVFFDNDSRQFLIATPKPILKPTNRN